MDKKYQIILNRVIDGDSFEVDIVLGFGIILQNKHIRLNGIDTPELRTSDDEEKKYGLLAKSYVLHWCGGDRDLFLVIKNPSNEYDKFGRILGDLEDAQGNSLVDDLIKNFHGVAYKGQSKSEIKKAHLANRIKLKTI